jgi:asparagine synthase (glutamine-hydrolysing)
MCGIAGVLSSQPVPEAVLQAMAQRIVHRGPDDHGVWSDPEAGIGLSHRRLSIIELSPHGHQPMVSADGRWMLCYNGEIYNHAALRDELEAAGRAPTGGWRGHSDTETLVEGIAAWGLEATLKRCVGMFAFALWDREARTLSLVRDRFGEKPLYYGWAGGDFLFGSELKALRAHPRFVAEIDRGALDAFTRRGFVPAPRSIYRKVFKLEPGCILTLTRDAAGAPREVAPREGVGEGGCLLTRYWSYAAVVREGLEGPVASEAEALAMLDEALGQSVRDQAVADVPVGAFLSGGIDSSAVVALYQKHSATPMRTFSIGFDDPHYDEAPFAKAIAAQLGTVHAEHYVSAREAQDVIPLLPAMYDEPFADSSQIPTFLVSRFARGEVTVALSGDGGDELFGGYNRHVAGPPMWRRIGRVPAPLRRALLGPASRIPARVWSRAARLSPGRSQPHVGTKLQKALRVAASAGRFEDVFESFLDEWSLGPSPVLGDTGVFRARGDSLSGDVPDAVRMMYWDATAYLPDDILCKVDRAAMAVSLETRVPFLDHRVAAAAARIPLAMKMRNGQGKHILRELLFANAPKRLFDRPKTGFGIPVGAWLRGPLRDWAEDLLDPRRMREAGYLDAGLVTARWHDHLAGRVDASAAIWSILMFEAWRREAGAA